MKNIWTIVKKELRRFFFDPRMLLSALLPGIIIFVLYSFMGNGITESFTVPENYKATVIVENMPSELSSSFEGLNLNVQASENAETSKQKVVNGEADLFVIFPDGFYQAIINYDSKNSANTVPEVAIFYNSAEITSSTMYQKLSMYLNIFETNISNVFDVNLTSGGSVVSEEDELSNIFAMIFPFIVIIMLYSGCMAIATESIAGEKERGTIATLLITPIKRSELAIGKIISLSIISLVTAITSFFGIMLSFPKLYGGSAADFSQMFSFGEYAMLLLVIITMVLLFVAIISTLSTLAKTVKEATGYAMPFMILVMVIGIMSFLFTPSATEYGLCFVPVYNSVFAMQMLMTGDAGLLLLSLTVISNLLYTGLFVFLLTKLFSNEKVMFSK